MLVPPLVAAIARTRPFAAAVARDRGLACSPSPSTAGLAYVAPAYTHEEPLRRIRARRAGGRRSGASGTWGRSSRASISAKAAPPGWMPAADRTDATRAVAALAASVRLPRRPDPASARRRSPSLRSPSSRSRPAASWSVTVMPRQPGLAVSFVLPDGLEPARSNLPGHRPARPLDGHLSSRRRARDSSSAPASAASTPAGCATFASSRPRPARRRLGLAAAGVAAAGADGLDGRSDLDRGALRAADCAGAAATLDYVTVTVFGVTAER